MPCRLGEALGCSAREVGPDGCRMLHTPQHHSGCSGTAREEKWEWKNHWQLIQSVYNKHEHFKILAIFCTLRKLVHVHVDLQQIAALLESCMIVRIQQIMAMIHLDYIYQKESSLGINSKLACTFDTMLLPF